MKPSPRTAARSRKTLQFLYSLQKTGMKFGLQNISLLLAGCGNPHQRFRSIHVAGTNGKGSTSSMIAGILRASGRRTGLYTSPHLVSFTERIRIDGVPIPERRLVDYVEFLRPLIERLNATYFEAATAVAFMYFADEQVDVAVIEVGLGGRLDSTNVITPLLSVITAIGRDHTEYLGTTLRHIAGEKAGIMKTGIPCITAETKSEVLSELRRIAKKRGVPLIVARELTDGSMRSGGLKGSVVELSTPFRRYRNLRIELPGLHQVRNAAIAVLAAEYLSARFSITERSICAGLGRTGRLSGLRGRLQVVRNRPLIIIDVAHNPHGMESTVRSLIEYGYAHFIVVFGVMKDKDHGRMLTILKPIARLLIATEPETSRALASGQIVAEARRRGIRTIGARKTNQALRQAVAAAKAERLPVLIVGSHYLAGEIIQKNNW